MKPMRQRVWVLSAAVVLACASMARAQVLADKVPADALFYAGWQGTDAIGNAYEGSHLKGLVEALNVPEQVRAMMKLELAKKTDPAEVEDQRQLQAFMEQVLKSPGAIFVGPMDWAEANKPVPRIGFIFQVGKANATEWAGRLKAAEVKHAKVRKEKKENDPPTKFEVVGDFLVVTVGDLPDYAKLVAGETKGETLAKKKEFMEGFSKLEGGGKDRALSVFISGQGIMANINEAVELKNDAQLRRMWPLMVDALGVESVRYGVWAGKFDGADWISEGFVAFNAKRAGVVGFFDSKPLGEDVLKMIPQSATSAGVWRFDGVRLLADIRDAAGRADERGAQMFDTVMEQAFFFSGVDVQKDLFPALSDEFVYYTTPDAAGLSMRGLVMINKLKDPKKASDALDNLEAFINASITQRDPDSKRQFRAEKMKVPLENTTIHTLNLPEASPSWAIHEGVLYVALSPQGLESAITGAMKRKAGETLLDNAEFTALRKKLGAQKISSFGFYDLARTAPEIHEILSQAMAKEKAAHPDKPQVLVLPPLDKLKAHFTAGLNIYWSDEAGWHAQGVGPFPMASMLSSDGLLMLGAMDKMKKEEEARRAKAGAGAVKKGAAGNELP